MAPVNKIAVVQFLSLVLVLTLLAGCGGSSRPDPPAPPTPLPLNAQNVNLIFVVSEDLAYQAAGDINPTTANLTSKGLQRSLLMATFLEQKVLGTKNVTGIYALEPMTHLQTASQHPDMVAFETVQQFAMLNQSHSVQRVGLTPYTAHSFPLNVSYGSSPVPGGVTTPFLACTACQGLDFRDQDGDNEALVSAIVKANAVGLLCFLGAMGDHQQSADKHQSTRRIWPGSPVEPMPDLTTFMRSPSHRREAPAWSLTTAI